jgi:hypothetical protein
LRNDRYARIFCASQPCVVRNILRENYSTLNHRGKPVGDGPGSNFLTHVVVLADLPEPLAEQRYADAIEILGPSRARAPLGRQQRPTPEAEQCRGCRRDGRRLR